MKLFKARKPWFQWGKAGEVTPVSREGRSAYLRRAPHFYVRQNMNKVRCFAIATLFAAPISSMATGPRLTEFGLGKLKIGMPLTSIRVPLEQPIEKNLYTRDGSCFYISPSGVPHYNLMIEHGVLTRIDVVKPGIKTMTGVSVGDSIQKINAVYGAAALETPNFYDAELPDFTVKSKDGQFELRFGTRDGKVESIIAGRSKSVAYVEGCL
jgi:hypothetical protein